MTPKTLKRNISKWLKVKIIFILNLFLTNVLELYLVDDFFKKCWLAIFQSKSESFHLYVVVFLWCIPANWESKYDSHATNRSAVAGGGSHRESSLLPIGSLSVIYDSQTHGYPFLKPS
jgi:hypothetical protein